MRVYKDTPFEFGLMPWEVNPPTKVALVFLKGTFDLAPGCPIAVEQQQITGEVPFDDVEIPSLRCESDYALHKPRGEWLLRGHAYAPGGEPAPLVQVRARVGPLAKRMVVFGDRVWRRSLTGASPSPPVPFTSMELRWERAFGGPRIAGNPAGRGTGPMETDAGPVEPLPNIERPDRVIANKGDQPEPVGTFAIPATWAARTRFLGSFDQEWLDTRWPYLPADLDWHHYMSAPEDQWLPKGYWRGDESLRLEGLHPEHPRLDLSLPGVRGRCFIERALPGRSYDPAEDPGDIALPILEAVPMVLDTISVDSGLLQVVCVWRGVIQGVSDDLLSNIGRLFFLHEPITADRPIEAYQAQLHARLVEEASDYAEDEAEEPAPETPALPAGDTEPAPAPLVDPYAAAQNVFAAMAGVFELDELARGPSVAEVREAFEEQGLEPPEELQEPVADAIPEGLPTPPSILRLAAILRRRLGKPFGNFDWSDAPWAGLDLEGADLRQAILQNADLRGVRFGGANLAGAVLYGVRADGGDFRSTNLEGAELTDGSFRGCDFTGSAMGNAFGTGVDLERAVLLQVAAPGLELIESRLTGAYLNESSFDGADFSGSRLDGARIVGASLVDASLEGCSLVGVRMERCAAANLRASEGVDVTDAVLVLLDAPGAQFQGARGLRTNLSGSNFEGGDFSEARLVGANFVRCRLREAVFAHADLTSAQIMEVDAFEASFDHAQLREADLRGSLCFQASFFRTQIDGTRFAGAILTRTYLEGRELG
jgi:uncharacterized protein YjbI with pentapeptide repeats